jgi:hypothetical protein
MTSALTALATLTRASTITRAKNVRWLNGGILPLPTSPSFVTSKTHAFTALEQGLDAFTGSETSFEYTSFLPNGSTTEDLLLQKQQQGQLTLTTQIFDGLGKLVRAVNGISDEPANSKFWRLDINGVASPDKGISQRLINTGDTVKLVLGSALNDRGIFSESFDATETIFTNATSFWKGRFLTNNDWPLNEFGSVRYDFFEIVAPNGSYFVPSSILCTRKILRWNSTLHDWDILSTIPIQTSASGFIGKSWNGLNETSFSQTSTRMFYGGTGTGFPPMPGISPENNRIIARRNWLLEEQIAIRTTLEVLFIYPDGSSFTEKYEWITLQAGAEFTKMNGVSPQPLRIDQGKVHFDMPPGETGVVEIQTSSNLYDWKVQRFTDKPTEEFVLPQGERFARAMRRK